MKTNAPRRRGLVILGVVMADLAFNLCLQALVDDFQEDRRMVEALHEARAELTRVQEEIRQAALEEPPGQGQSLDPPACEVSVDAELRLSLDGTEIGVLGAPSAPAVEHLRAAVAQIPPGRLRLRLDRRVPVEVYAALWPAIAGRELTLAVE